MKKLALSLMLISLLAGCAKNPIPDCPQFPIPPPEVQKKLDALSETDRKLWAWGNDLLDLCKKLGTCE